MFYNFIHRFLYLKINLFIKGQRRLSNLINGFYLNGTIFFNNSAVTSLTVDTYKSYVCPDSLYKLIIDKDPLVELWDCKKRKKHLFFDNDGIDIKKLNEIISKGKLDKYFDRIK